MPFFFYSGRIAAQGAQLYPQAYPVHAVMTIPAVAKLRLYPEGTTIKKMFRDTSEVKLISPEYVLASMASANSHDWDIFHAENDQVRRKAPMHYQTIDSHPLGFPLFELHYVLEVEENDGQVYAFARIALLGIGDRKPLAGYFFRKINGVWKLETARRSIEENYALLVIKPQILQQLIAGDPRNMDADLLALRQEITDDSGLNLALLGRLVWAWFQDDALYTERIGKYCDNPNWND